MIALEIRVSGATAVADMLGRIPDLLRKRLVAAMAQSMTELGAAVRANVPVRTGNARSSVNVQVYESQYVVRGRVFASGATGSHGYLLRFFEKGVDRDVHVRTYVRRAARGDVHAIGRSGKPLKHRYTAVGIQQVASYDRHAQVPMLRPFGTAWDSLRARIERSLTDAIEGVPDAAGVAA